MKDRITVGASNRREAKDKLAKAQSLPDQAECKSCGKVIGTGDDTGTLMLWKDTDMNDVYLCIDCYEDARRTGKTKWYEDALENSGDADE